VNRMVETDGFTVKRKLFIGNREYVYYSIDALLDRGFGSIHKLPYSIKVLLEAAVRQFDGHAVTLEHVKQIAGWTEGYGRGKEIPFLPARILLQDFTGVPVVADLASMRSAMKRSGGDPSCINPLVPVDLVIDHSLMVDAFGTKEALEINMNMEFKRNAERYRFLHWAETAFDRFRVVPPSTGIVHQVNLEYLATVATVKTLGEETEVYPDSLVGTDSHTTMINGLGVAGWGVGGIEAEAGMLGQPLYFVTPEVVGFKLSGELADGVTATDLALSVTEILRKKGVVGRFVEFYGSGISSISVEDRATIANMAPEYGATMSYFPVDAQTLEYLKATGREEEQVSLVEAYYKIQGMFRTNDTPDPMFSTTVELDMSTVVTSLAGPKRPQDRAALTDMKDAFNTILRAPVSNGGYGLSEEDMNTSVELQYENGKSELLKTGSVVIAAITSCTNTSNPSVMLGAGLVAKKAVERGLVKPACVKSSLTPGSPVVTEYLKKTGLLEYLEKLGFFVAGYGCATCIGNSGPLPDEVSRAITDTDMTVTAVLSGNRNFEGRIHPQVKASYLASPMLVVAYALAGTVNIDLASEPLGYDDRQQPVYLKDIWPGVRDIREAVRKALTPDMFRNQYKNIFRANKLWNAIPVTNGLLYEWDSQSTYIKEPPFFKTPCIETDTIQDIAGARILALLGDSVTTDHISPAGSISAKSPAGEYLLRQGVKPEDFNSYGSRRGNHEVMMRGTFANIRIRNEAVPGTEGGVTSYYPEGKIMPIYDAAMKYQDANTPLVVLAGKEYGAGSSRDWAAKGVSLLGVKAVIVESFERIHRGNLAGMGVLPLQFTEDAGWRCLGITGAETIDIRGLSKGVLPGQKVRVTATTSDGGQIEFEAVVRLDSLVEVEYYRNGGILQTVLKKLTGE
jgi:aconitate hydratase